VTKHVTFFQKSDGKCHFFQKSDKKCHFFKNVIEYVTFFKKGQEMSLFLKKGQKMGGGTVNMFFQNVKIFDLIFDLQGDTR